MATRVRRRRAPVEPAQREVRDAAPVRRADHPVQVRPVTRRMRGWRSEVAAVAAAEVRRQRPALERGGAHLGVAQPGHEHPSRERGLVAGVEHRPSAGEPLAGAAEVGRELVVGHRPQRAADRRARQEVDRVVRHAAAAPDVVVPPMRLLVATERDVVVVDARRVAEALDGASRRAPPLSISSTSTPARQLEGEDDPGGPGADDRNVRLDLAPSGSLAPSSSIVAAHVRARVQQGVAVQAVSRARGRHVEPPSGDPTSRRASARIQ